MLHGLGQRVIVNSATSSIGTPAFSAQISNGCSGLEGISLMFGFVAIYLWCYRRELRFPQALVLLPIGIGMVWILNAVRITALLMIGSINGRAAVSGFHSVAGWLSLSVVGCGLVIVSWRVPAFTRAEPAPAVSRANPAGLYLLPLLTIIATAMVTRIVYPGFDFLYPLRVLAAATVLWIYRKELGALGWGVPIWAVAMGLLVFAIWIAIAPAADPRLNAAFAADLNGLSFWTRATWLFFRVFGAVITVPIAEELAFRGYLMRKLIADDFAQVPMGSFTWVSFLGSSILFGAMHGEWIAGIVAGMVFAAAVCRRGRLADAIAVHAISNALLAIYVLATHNWPLWT
jgi:exosortase E/protease (VPEID-CTERM system)